MGRSSGSQDWIWVACAALTTLTFTGCQVLSFLSMDGDGVIFNGSMTNISDQYSTEITPTCWTFAIWGVIYIIQALWIIHALVSIFRTSPDEGPLYKNPEIVSRLFLLVYALNLCLNGTWLILFDRLLFEAALVVLALITLTLYVILADYYRRITQSVKVMAKEHKVDLIFFRLFLQNGVSMYATWVSIATLLNLTLVLVYRADVSQQVACLIALSILTLELVVFVVLDWFVLERYMRYTFTTYLTILWALFGSISANWDPTKPHSIMSAVLLAVSGVLFIGKIVITVVNSQKKPLYSGDITPTKEHELVA